MPRATFPHTAVPPLVGVDAGTHAPLPADNILFACGQKKGATRRPLPSLR